MGAGFVRFPSATAVTVDEATAPSTARATHVTVQHRVRYVRLRPGQRAPAGARVIREDAPAPRIIVRHVAAPAPVSVRRPIVRTRQSGAR
jgi:hypothetical protein